MLRGFDSIGHTSRFEILTQGDDKIYLQKFANMGNLKAAVIMLYAN